MKLQDINFPIFPLRAYNKLYYEDNILYIETYYNNYIIDNKNLTGDTLAKRRLRLPAKNRYPLNLALFTIAQLVKSKTKVFLDNYGNLIEYKRTKMVKICYKKIIRYKESDKGEVAIWMSNIPYPIYVSKYYMEQFRYKDLYAGILNYGGGYILFELSQEKKKDIRRKI